MAAIFENIGIAMLMLALIFVSGLFMGWKFRRVHTPSRLHPNPMSSRNLLVYEIEPQWMNRRLMEASIHDFHAAGFLLAGYYSIPKLGGLLLAGFTFPDGSIFGSAYDNSLQNPSFDICIQYQDGTLLDISNSNELAFTNADQRPGKEFVFLKGASVAQALAEAHSRMAHKPIQRITPDRFRANFERNYSDDIEWKMKWGGVALDEGELVADSFAKCSRHRG